MGPNTHIIKYIIYVFIFVAIASYGIYQFRGVVWGPQITINSPKNGSLLANGELKIEGESKDISSLFLNGRRIFTDVNGQFVENVLLLDGYNLIEVKAVDKMDRTAVKHLQIVYKSGDSTARVEEVARLTGSQL
ncbi:MAG: hypothetical protein HZA95_02440 [Candidatus Vogelbacteria bacterium]|nr:hypothetical protein [Candidatus Vogelbacteria bacterium]